MGVPNFLWKQDQEVACELSIETTWMTPVFDYLQNDILLENREEAQKVKAISARFTIIQGKLYRKSFSSPYLTRVKPLQVNYIRYCKCFGGLVWTEYEFIFPARRF